MAEAVEDKILDVMQKIEAFYFDEGEDSGEQMFNKFAAKYAQLFDTDCDAQLTENKLEYLLSFHEYLICRYTQVYKEFQELFESKTEGKLLI